MAIDTNKIPEYNRIDYENDDLSVQRAKQEAINQQFASNQQFANEDNDQTVIKANAVTNIDNNNNS